MVRQQSTSLRSVVFAGLALVASAAAFAAAFYLLDGTSIVSDLLAHGMSYAPSHKVAASTEPTANTLQLPQGMDEDYVLQIWQEQIDSQELIGHLVDGDIKSMTINSVNKSSTEATIDVSVRLSDRSSVFGSIGFIRLGNLWYVSFVSHKTDERIISPQDRWPSISDIDVPLMNAILKSQGLSQAVFDEYLAGTVYKIDFTRVRKGVNTVTLDAAMHEKHGIGRARIIAIEKVVDGKTCWFLARFIKVGDEPLKK